MLYTTFRLAHEAGACIASYKKMAKTLGGINKFGRDTPIPLTRILEVCGLNNALWVLRCMTDQTAADKLARIFACDCAERVLPIYENQYPENNRIRNCIKVARQFALGKATKKELDAARAAAWDAWVAAGDAGFADRVAEIKWQIEHLKELLEEEDAKTPI